MNKKPFQWVTFACIVLLSVSLSSCGVKDSTIQEKIAEAAKSTPELTGVNASVKDGIVTLTGEVKDDAAKMASETAIKAIKGVKSVVDNLTVAPPPAPVVAPAPVEISADDALTKGVTDAVKDFSTVKANVKDGVVTLTGELKRSSLPKLLQSLSSLKPKKIDNQLTLK
ncbi:MAG: BON domain-containing protein [Bacteroidetes bacterium]|nr:BON domain-containing protein [Bacteroidota bacterium]